MVRYYRVIFYCRKTGVRFEAWRGLSRRAALEYASRSYKEHKREEDARYIVESVWLLEEGETGAEIIWEFMYNKRTKAVEQSNYLNSMGL